jgi:RNA recognition motif-containing protein
MDNNSNSDNMNSNNANNNHSSATANDNNVGHQQSSGDERNRGWGGRNDQNSSSYNDNYSRNNNNRRWNGDRARPTQDRAGKELYCGNLPGDVTDDELHDLFRKYGKIERIKVLGRRSDSKFAFVVFGRAEDALEAARGRDGIQFAGRSIKVEISKSGERGRGGRGNDDRFDRGGDRRFRDDRRRDDRGSFRDDRRHNDRGNFRDDRRGNNFRDDRRRDDRRGGDRRKCFHIKYKYSPYTLNDTY